MKKDDKASVSLKKVISMSIILLFIMGIGVMAASSKINNVKIILSDGHEMDVLTSKTKVSDILEENHIILLPNEKVIPSLEEELSDNKTIRIVKNNSNELKETVSDELSVNKVLEDYNVSSEKIVKEQVTISYETETKDLSTGNGSKEEKVVRNGIDGIKEITYKVKYLNGEEIEKVQISENIIKTPVNCVKEIRNKKVETTSRGSSSIISGAPAANGSALAAKVEGKTPRAVTLNASAYCYEEAPRENYTTASGATPRVWYTVAAGRGYAMGTIIYIPYFANKPNGGWFVVQDRGGAISNNHLDIFMGSLSECYSFGRRNLQCYVYE